METGRFILPDNFDYLRQADESTLEKLCAPFNNFPWTSSLLEVIKNFTDPKTWRYSINPSRNWIHRYPVQKLVQISASAKKEDAQAFVFVEVIIPRDHIQRPSRSFRYGEMEIHLSPIHIYNNTFEQVTHIAAEDHSGPNTGRELVSGQPVVEVFSGLQDNAARNYLWLYGVKTYLAQKAEEISRTYAHAEDSRGLTTIIVSPTS